MVEVPPFDITAIRAVLAQIPDPEVPVVTLDDLGIIRDVEIKDGDIHITLTPTYMGCPATLAIRKMVGDTVQAAGYPKPVLHEQLTPAWSTDWIRPEALKKLEDYGIAPPNPAASNAPKACPHCGSQQTRLVSRFGSTACKALYQCESCREPFEYFKSH